MKQIASFHNHTAYSYLDGASKIPELVARAKELNYAAIGISDHGHLSGIIDFYKECKKQEIKPILGCLLAGQPILTLEGIKPVEKIEIGDLVLTHEGRFKPVTNIMQREYSGALWDIQLNQNGPSIKMTSEHPVLISNNKGQTSWAKPSEILTGQITKRSGLMNWNSYACMPKIKSKSSKPLEYSIIDFLPRDIFTLSDNGAIMRPRYKKSTSDIVWENLPTKFTLDEDLAFILGLYVAEGSVDSATHDSDKLSGQFTFTIGKDFPELPIQIQEVFKKTFNLDLTICDRGEKGSFDIYKCSLPIAYLLSGLCGKGFINKKVPSIIWEAPLSVRWAFLDGLLTGDGKNPNKESNKNGSRTLKMSSISAIYGARALLADFGEFPKVGRSTKINGNDSYYITYTPNKINSVSWTSDNYVHRPIKAINQEQYKGLVYNFEVADDNSYTSDFVLHNCEFYHTDDRTLKESVKQENEHGVIDGSDKRYYHLSVYAKDNEGYHNLLKLNSDAFLNGYYFQPRCDNESIAEYANGLIIGTGCLGGKVLQQLLHDNYKGALKTAAEFQDMVGKDNLFVELMNHGLPEQRKTNPMLLQIAKEIGAPAIATMDSHYVHKHSAIDHDCLLCCQTGAQISDTRRFRFHNDEYYLKSADEMYALFADNPEVLTNGLVLAERCDVHIDFDSFHLPEFPDVPAEFDSDYDYLEHLVYQGLRERYGDIPEEALERAAYELGVIRSMGFASYFLIFWDIANFAKSQNVVTGAARGSAGGVLCSWALGITKVNPLEYGLIFERFLNPDRVSLPDIDYDVPNFWRETLINYTKEKYGEDKVTQIITFNKIKPRSAIRDTARVLGYDYATGDKISKALPPLLMGFDTPLKACFNLTDGFEAGYKNAQGLREMYDDSEHVRKIVNTAMGIEDLIRGYGKHAAGVIIADQAITNLVPIRTSKDGDIITQWDKKVIEELGLLKMDYLGLKNLDVITETLRRLSLPVTFLDDLPMDDPTTFQLLQNGEGIGVFQVESPQMRQLLKKVKPTRLEDVSAVLALYRPGPMAENMHNDYAERKHGHQPAIPFHSDAAEILRDTQQLMIYQEQIMTISQRFAGYSMSDADNLRRIIGKKLPEQMKPERARFIQGCLENGYSEDLANRVFNAIEAAASYSFNASHSVGYSFITYWTAYFKAHYPKEYMASLCSMADDLDQVAVYLNEARRMGLRVYPPDLNNSEITYTVEDDGIRMGIGGMKHLGEKAADKLLKERNNNGKFTSLYDFARRFNPNIKAFKSLAYSGALDKFGTRQGISSIAEDILKATRKEAKKNSDGQTSLFQGVVQEVEFTVPTTEFQRSELLSKEKETLGIFVSGHPLDEYTLKKDAYTVADLKSLDVQKQPVEVLCMIDTINVKYTKKGDTMAIVTVEDQTGMLEMVVFPKSWEQFKDVLKVGSICYFTLRIGTDFRDEKNYVTLGCKSITEVDEVVNETFFGIYLPRKFHLDTQYMSLLKGIVLSYHGNIPLRLYTKRNTMLKLSNEYFIEDSDELRNEVKRLFQSYQLEKGK